jgi:hypothetical protein
VERLLELVVQVALDILAHLLSERGVTLKDILRPPAEASTSISTEHQ